MDLVIRIIVHIVLEFVAYGIGKVVSTVLWPHLKIEPFHRQKFASGWKWKGFIYYRGSSRCL